MHELSQLLKLEPTSSSEKMELYQELCAFYQVKDFGDALDIFHENLSQEDCESLLHKGILISFLHITFNQFFVNLMQNTGTIATWLAFT
jgi:hypothetical protein